MFTYAKCLDEKKYGYCIRIHNKEVKKAKLAIELNPEITGLEVETILNGDVELTDKTREGIMNSVTWQIKSKILRFHGKKPSDEDIKFANKYQTKEEKADQRKKDMPKRKEAYALLE